jgi:hypothetical protein
MPEHMPCEHRGVAPVQTVPHIPQLAGSDAVLTQPEGHAFRPAVHEQTPPAQLWPIAQATLHMPQWRRSVAVVVQTPLQFVWPTAQLEPPAVPPIGPVPATPAAPPVPVPPFSLSSLLVAVGCAEQLPIKRSAPAAIAANTKRACMGGILT